MNRLPYLIVLLVLSGCWHAQSHRDVSSLAQLRIAAKQRPHDPQVLERLLEAEMFDPEGEPLSAAELSASVAEGHSKQLRALILSALHADTHGDPAASLDALLEALALAGQSSDPLAPQLSEFLIHALSGLQDGAIGYAPRVMAALDAHTAGLPAPARYAAIELRMRLAQQAGDLSRIASLAVDAGCVVEALGTEPFGARPLLGFDEEHGVDPGAPLKAAYDLGLGRGVHAVRHLYAHGCALHLGGGALADGGTRFVQFPLINRATGELLLRIDTPNSVEVYVDGASVARLDRRVAMLPRVHLLPLHMAAGDHLITLKVTSRHPSPVLAFAVAPLRAADLPALAKPRAIITPFQRFLHAALEVAHGDVVSGRQTLASVTEQDSPYLLMQHAEVVMVDPLSPEQVAADEGRMLLLQARKADKGLWAPAARVAALAEENGRTMEAIEALRELAKEFPNVPAIGLRLASVLRSKGWDDAADVEIRRLRRVVPDACGPLKAELDMVLSRGRHAAAAALVDKTMACDATGNARYMQLLRQRDWGGASAELRRLEQFTSRQLRYAYLVSGLELAREQRDEAASRALLAELRSSYPRSENAVLEDVDHKLESGEHEQALRELSTAVASDSANMLGLHRLLPVLGGHDVLEAYRVDGRARIATFEQSGRNYEGPQVLVFDYMAVRVFDDGSSLELVHTIQKAQSEEAVDELAEVSVPNDARVLTLRLVKQGGAILEADAISGKDTVSLPGMSQGDYVELEYLRSLPPPDGFPGGYLGDRFFFSSYEVPFDHSELVVVSSVDLPLELDRRGKAPSVQVSKRGQLLERHFVVEQSSALSPEPASVSPREFVPSVRLGYRADWKSFVSSIREMLVDRDMGDPELRELALSVVGDAAPTDYRLRAKRLYDFVLETVENDDDIFSQAAIMFRARSGSRARVLNYLLQLADVPAELVLVRSAAADQTPSEMADTDTYEHLLVRVGQGDASFLLFTPETHASFGYIPSLLRAQPGLVLTEDAPRVTVPPAQVGDELRLIDANLQLAADGSATLSIVERVRGAGAASWRRELESVPQVELKRRFEQEYVVRLLPGGRLTALDIAGRSRDDAEFVLRYEVALDALSRKTAQGWAVPALFSSELAGNYARIPSRNTAMFTGTMVETDVRMRLTFPEGAQRPQSPPSFALAADGGKAQFRQQAAYEGDALVMRRTLRIEPQRVLPEQYSAFVEFCRAVDAAEDKEFLFSP